MEITTQGGQKFQDGVTVSGPLEAFFQPRFDEEEPRILYCESDKRARCEFCHSRYNADNLIRKRRHESGECKP